MNAPMMHRARDAGFGVWRWLQRKEIWRGLAIVAVLVAAAALGRSPSRTRLVWLALAFGMPFAVGQDVRQLLLTFPAIALLLPFQISTGTDVSLNAAVFGVIGLVGLGIVQKLYRRDLYLARSRLNRPLVALSLVSVLSLLVGNVTWDPSVPRPSNMLLVQFGQLAIYFLSFLMLWLTASVISNLHWLRRLTYAVIITGGGGITLVLLSHLLGLPLPLDRVTLNMFTVWLAPLALAQAGLDADLTSRQRHLLLGVCCTTVIAIAWIYFVKANWIGGWGPPLLAIVLLLWLRYPRIRGSMLLVAAILFFVVGLKPFLQALDFDFEQKWDISGGSRVTLWRSVTELAASRPLLGLGIAAYRHYHFLKPLAYRTTLWMRPTVSAHNMFVDLFAQMGVLGLTCYLWFLAEAFRLAWRVYKRQEGFAKGYALAAFCALIGIMAADMLAETSLPFVYNMGFPGFSASVVSWMMLGGLVVLENQSGVVDVTEIATEIEKN